MDAYYTLLTLLIREIRVSVTLEVGMDVQYFRENVKFAIKSNNKSNIKL